VEKDDADQEADSLNQRASMRDRLYSHCSDPSTLWPHPYPDDANNETTFDMVFLTAVTCFPDGTGAAGQTCKKVWLRACVSVCVCVDVGFCICMCLYVCVVYACAFVNSTLLPNQPFAHWCVSMCLFVFYYLLVGR